MDITFWFRIAIVIVGFFVALRFSMFAYGEKSWVMTCYSTAIYFVVINHGLLLASQNYQLGDLIPIMESATGWASIGAISVIYCGLAHLIREDKPKVARFPIVFTALPLLIVLSYPFAHETEVIDEWLFQIYEAGAFTVAILVYGFQTIHNRRSYYYKVLAGIFFLLISYITYWFLEGIEIIQTWGWQVSFLAGIIFIYSGYKEAIHE